MTSTAQTTSLEGWFQSHGGYLHPDIRILQASPDSSSGIHYRATGPIPPGTTFAHAPHSLALSYLNALVDDSAPVFAQQRNRFKVEAIGFWYLMTQYVNLESSFWKPYLETIPAPDSEFTQPLFFDDPEDVKWLEGTDVGHTALARKEVYEQYYNDGVEILREAGIDVVPYTWNLFRWAVTMFSSRSFSSRALHPGSSKCWTTYKSTLTGSREPVLLDMSGVPGENLIFPVLFPGLDAANHDHNAKVEWTFEPGRFSLALAEDGPDTEAGKEVFNNYGPKGNGELLLGYGFCIPRDPHDTVALTLKQPSPSLQQELKAIYPTYFAEGGDWNAEKTTAYLRHPPSQLDNPEDIFHHLPEALLELLLYVLRDERNLPLTLETQPLRYITAQTSAGREYAPHIARVILRSLSHKMQALQSSTPPTEPQNARQLQAAIYRRGQISILTSLTFALQSYIDSIIWTLSPSDTSRTSKASVKPPVGPHLLSLSTLHTLLTHHSIISADFLKGVEANTNSNDLATLCDAGWEEDLVVLLLSYTLTTPSQRQPAGPRGKAGLHQMKHQWFRTALREYIQVAVRAAYPAAEDARQELEDVENAQELLTFVHTAAEACGRGSVWADPDWSAQRIVAVGRVAIGRDSFQILTDVPGGGQVPRTYLCLYFAEQEGEQQRGEV